MHPDFNELFAILNAEQVKYLIIGGYAVSPHAQPRATKDLDILIKPDKDNAAALFRALAKFGAPLDELTRTTSPIAARFSAWDRRPSWWTSCRRLPASIFTALGSSALWRPLMKRRGCGWRSFPPPTS